MTFHGAWWSCGDELRLHGLAFSLPQFHVSTSRQSGIALPSMSREFREKNWKIINNSAHVTAGLSSCSKQICDQLELTFVLSRRRERGSMVQWVSSAARIKFSWVSEGTIYNGNCVSLRTPLALYFCCSFITHKTLPSLKLHFIPFIRLCCCYNKSREHNNRKLSFN